MVSGLLLNMGLSIQQLLGVKRAELWPSLPGEAVGATD